MTCLYPTHRQEFPHLRTGTGENFCPRCAARIREGVHDIELKRFRHQPGCYAALVEAVAFWTRAAVPAGPGASAATSCWPWNGLASIEFQGRPCSPQGLAYRLAWGSPGPGTIHVICGNDACVNPFHLRVPELGHPPTTILLADRDLQARAGRSIQALEQLISEELGGAPAFAAANR